MCFAEVMSTLIKSDELVGQEGPFDSIKQDDWCHYQWRFAIPLDRTQESDTAFGDLSNFSNASKRGQTDLFLALLEVNEHVLRVIQPHLGIDREFVHEMQQDLDTPIQYRKVVPSSTTAGSEKTQSPIWLGRQKWTRLIKSAWTF